MLSRFVDIELLVGLLGGLSAMVLFVVFAWLSAPFRTVLYALVFAIGVLVGMEIPLVMRALQRRAGTKFSELVSRVLTFDYLGALAVSLLFPLRARAAARAVAHRAAVRHRERRRSRSGPSIASATG